LAPDDRTTEQRDELAPFHWIELHSGGLEMQIQICAGEATGIL
jgi:hypothetical protein